MTIRRRREVDMMAALILASLLAIAAPPPAAAQDVHAFDVSSTDPASAIRAFGAQAELQILASADDLKGKRFNPVSGHISTEDGLNNMLAGTGLGHQYVGDRAVALVNNAAAETPANENINTAAVNRSAIQLAQENTHGSVPNPAVPAPNSTRPDKDSSSVSSDSERIKLDEIVVSAQKREERLQDVPVPVTAISADALVDQNQRGFQDYFSDFPGLNFGAGNRGEVYLAIRGLTTGNYSNPTVGTVIDDMPFGASAGTFSASNIDPSDLDRIEVLRGPQGTLYGASSLGGLIKYVVNDPSTDAVSGRVEAGTAGVYNGAQLGYNARATVNVPLSDTLAVRATAFTREDPGYVDDPVRHVDGVNEGHTSGGHLAARWSPSETFSVKLSALIQHLDTDGSALVFVNSPFVGLQNNYPTGAGGYDNRDEAFGATVKAQLGSIDLTSISGYSYFKHDSSVDTSGIFASSTEPLYGVGTSYIADSIIIHKFSEEVRLSSSIGAYVDWLAGVFYTNESVAHYGNFLAVDLATPTTYLFGSADTPVAYREYAVFGNLTFHVTDQLDVQVGARQSYDEQHAVTDVYTGQYAYRFLGSDPSITRVPPETEHPVTYLVTPEFKFSPNLMLYVRLASGWQPGGANLGAAPSPTYKPSTTDNYEIGIKGDFLDHSLTVDGSIYYIDWKDLPIDVYDVVTKTNYNINAGEAKSQGVELSVQSRPLPGLTLGGWIAAGDASLKQAFPATSSVAGATGDRLPYSTRFSGNLSLQQEFPLTDRWSGVFGALLTYMGDRQGNFQSSGVQRQYFPSYAKVDLRLGAKYESWKVNLSVDNVANKFGEIGGGLDGGIAPYPLLYTQPRTVSLSIAKSF
jgi:iron complex outermembrane recepter protein